MLSHMKDLYGSECKKRERASECRIARAVPDRCPVCKNHGRPTAEDWFVTSTRYQAFGICRCPINNCRSIYVGEYGFGQTVDRRSWVFGHLKGTSLVRFSREPEFPGDIQEISPQFCRIYQQALVAEENGLDQICGPGFRKALEFLIKDFLNTHKYPNDEEAQEQVKAASLGTVIRDHIGEPKIKQCAERAVWLGNDQTHYVRLWESKDISDLKSLIRMTVAYIQLAMDHERYMAEMPERRTHN
jgi:hypothetical protein